MLDVANRVGAGHLPTHCRMSLQLIRWLQPLAAAEPARRILCRIMLTSMLPAKPPGTDATLNSISAALQMLSCIAGSPPETEPFAAPQASNDDFGACADADATVGFRFNAGAAGAVTDAADAAHQLSWTRVQLMVRHDAARHRLLTFAHRLYLQPDGILHSTPSSPTAHGQYERRRNRQVAGSMLNVRDVTNPVSEEKDEQMSWLEFLVVSLPDCDPEVAQEV